MILRWCIICLIMADLYFPAREILDDIFWCSEISGGNMVDIYNAQRAARHIYQAYPNYSNKK